MVPKIYPSIRFQIIIVVDFFITFDHCLVQNIMKNYQKVKNIMKNCKKVNNHNNLEMKEVVFSSWQTKRNEDKQGFLTSLYVVARCRQTWCTSCVQNTKLRTMVVPNFYFQWYEAQLHL
jgi:hypothetical protein